MTLKQITVYLAIVATGSLIELAKVFRALTRAIPGSITITDTMILNTPVNKCEVIVAGIPLPTHFAEIAAAVRICIANILDIFRWAIPSSVTVTHACVLDTSVHEFKPRIPIIPFPVHCAIRASGVWVRVTDVLSSLLRAIPASVAFTEAVIFVTSLSELETLSTFPHLFNAKRKNMYM